MQLWCSITVTNALSLPTFNFFPPYPRDGPAACHLIYMPMSVPLSGWLAKSFMQLSLSILRRSCPLPLFGLMNLQTRENQNGWSVKHQKGQSTWMQCRKLQRGHCLLLAAVTVRIGKAQPVPDREESSKNQDTEQMAVARPLQPPGTSFCWSRDQIHLTPCSCSSKRVATATQHSLTDELLPGSCKQGRGENGLCWLWKLAVDLQHGTKQ